MSNVMIAGSNPSLVIGTVGANGTLSEQIDLASYNSIGLLADNASNGTLNFWVAYQPYVPGTLSDTYRLLRDNAGVAYALTLPTGSTAYKASDIAVLAPYRYVRIGTVATAQANSTTFTFVVKG